MKYNEIKWNQMKSYEINWNKKKWNEIKSNMKSKSIEIKWHIFQGRV